MVLLTAAAATFARVVEVASTPLARPPTEVLVELPDDVEDFDVEALEEDRFEVSLPVVAVDPPAVPETFPFPDRDEPVEPEDPVDDEWLEEECELLDGLGFAVDDDGLGAGFGVLSFGGTAALGAPPDPNENPMTEPAGGV